MIRNPRNWLRQKCVQSRDKKHEFGMSNNVSGRTSECTRDDVSEHSCGSHDSFESKVDSRDEMIQNIGIVLDAAIVAPANATLNQDIVLDGAIAAQSICKTETYTPQSYLDQMLQSRGYSIERYEVLQSGYYNTTTPAQQKSYHTYITNLVKDRKWDTLRSVFASGIISSNPANAFGESLIHLICRLGEADALQIMISVGSDVQVSDDFGRTPMHDACWGKRPDFDIIEMLLKIDPHLMFMMDVRGSLPLSYVRTSDYDIWIGFLSNILDVYWPPLPTKEGPPPLTRQGPNTRPISDPGSIMSSIYITLVASGRLSPEEALRLDNNCDASANDNDNDEHIFRSAFERMPSCSTFDFSKSETSYDASSIATYETSTSSDDDDDDIDQEYLGESDKCLTEVESDMQLLSMMECSLRDKIDLSHVQQSIAATTSVGLCSMTSDSVSSPKSKVGCKETLTFSKLQERYAVTPAMSLMSFASVEYTYTPKKTVRTDTIFNYLSNRDVIDTTESNFDFRDESEVGLTMSPQKILPIRIQPITPKYRRRLPSMITSDQYKPGPFQRQIMKPDTNIPNVFECLQKTLAISIPNTYPRSLCFAHDDGLLEGSC